MCLGEAFSGLDSGSSVRGWDVIKRDDIARSVHRQRERSDVLNHRQTYTTATA